MLMTRGVVARIVTGPHEAHRQDPHLPIRFDGNGNTGARLSAHDGPHGLPCLKIGFAARAFVLAKEQGRDWHLGAPRGAFFVATTCYLLPTSRCAPGCQRIGCVPLLPPAAPHAARRDCSSLIALSISALTASVSHTK